MPRTPAEIIAELNTLVPKLSGLADAAGTASEAAQDALQNLADVTSAQHLLVQQALATQAAAIGAAQQDADLKVQASTDAKNAELAVINQIQADLNELQSVTPSV